MARLPSAMNQQSKTNEAVGDEAVDKPMSEAEKTEVKGSVEGVEQAAPAVDAQKEAQEDVASAVSPNVGVVDGGDGSEPAAPDALEVARAETARMRDQMLRVAADFDNFRKRSRKENEDGARRAREELLRDLLPVFDNLERAVAHAEQASDPKAVADGVKIILKQFRDTVSKFGVKRLETEGAVFDPTVHEAIQQVVTADQPAGTIVTEVQPGYVWGDRLVRAAMVVVAKAPPGPAVPEESPSEAAN